MKEDFFGNEDDIDEEEKVVSKLQVVYVEGFGEEEVQEFVGLEDIQFLN